MNTNTAEVFLETTVGKEALAEFHQKEANKRTAMVAEIDNLHKQCDAELIPLTKALDATTSACNEAQRELATATIRKRTANAKLNQAKASYAHQVSRIEKQLLVSAPPEIDVFCDELKEESRKLRNEGIRTERDKSNAKSLNKRLIAICNAIRTAQLLKLQDVEDLASELQQIRDSLPEIIMQ